MTKQSQPHPRFKTPSTSSPSISTPYAPCRQILLLTSAVSVGFLFGIAKTAPYFHDNSAKSLEDVATHYAFFFNLITGGFINFTEQDQKDMVAFLKLLD